jgi:hypothetical protein
MAGTETDDQQASRGEDLTVWAPKRQKAPK